MPLLLPSFGTGFLQPKHKGSSAPASVFFGLISPKAFLLWCFHHSHMNKKRLIPPCFSLLSPFPQPQVTTAKVLVLLPRISTGALVRFFFTGQGKERRAKHMKRNWVRVAGVAGQTGAGQVRAHGRLGKQSGFPIFFFFSFLFFFFFWARFGRCFFEPCYFPTFDVVQAGCVRDFGFRFWVLGVGNARAWGCVRVRELMIFPWYFSLLSMSVLFLFIITPTTLSAYLPTYLTC
ncbi:hypothetical protein BKA81DRAFT_158684 [Phyllosticta paracitricarpa]